MSSANTTTLPNSELIRSTDKSSSSLSKSGNSIATGGGGGGGGGGEQHSVKSSDETVVRRGDGKQQQHSNNTTKKNSICSRITGGHRSVPFKDENVGSNSGRNGDSCDVIKEEESVRVQQSHCKLWLWCCRRRRKKKAMLWV